MDDSVTRLYQNALNHYADGKLTAAEACCAEALRSARAQDISAIEAVSIYNTLSSIRLDRGKARQAREDAMAALELAAELDEPGSNADADRARVQAISLIARSHMHAGNFDLARPLMERAMTMAHYWLHPESPEKVHALDLLGTLSKEAGHYDEAEEYYRKAIALSERVCGRFDGEVASCCLHLALLAEVWDEAPNLEPFGRRAYEIRCDLFGSTSPLTAAALTAFGVALAANGESDAAGEKFVHALAIFDRHYGATTDTSGITPETLTLYATCRRHAAWHLISNGRDADAREFSERAQRVFVRVLGEGHPFIKQWNKDHNAVKKGSSRSSGRSPRYSAWEWWRTFSFSR